jgi:hypothetical protein
MLHRCAKLSSAGMTGGSMFGFRAGGAMDPPVKPADDSVDDGGLRDKPEPPLVGRIAP